MTDLGQNGVWHKDGPLAQIRWMAEWADREGNQIYPDRETLRKIATNLRAAADALERDSAGGAEASVSDGNIYFLTNDQRNGILWAIRLGLAYDDGFPFPRDQNREILRTAQSTLDGSWKRQAPLSETPAARSEVAQRGRNASSVEGSDGRFRGISVPRLWPGHPDYEKPKPPKTCGFGVCGCRVIGEHPDCPLRKRKR